MKKLMISTVFATLLGSAASAGVAITGYTEYAVEAQEVTLNVGTELSVASIAVSPSLDFTYADSNGDFSGVNLDASYALTDSMSAYVEVDFNSDVEYDEATVGVSFNF